MKKIGHGKNLTSLRKSAPMPEIEYITCVDIVSYLVFRQGCMAEYTSSARNILAPTPEMKSIHTHIVHERLVTLNQSKCWKFY